MEQIRLYRISDFNSDILCPGGLCQGSWEIFIARQIETVLNKGLINNSHFQIALGILFCQRVTRILK